MSIATTELRRGKQRLVCNTTDVSRYLAQGWEKSDAAQLPPDAAPPEGAGEDAPVTKDLVEMLAAFRAKPALYKRGVIEEAIIAAKGMPDGGTKAELIEQLAGLLGLE